MYPAALALFLALAAPAPSTSEEDLESAIREGLASQGEVRSVDLVPTAGGRYAGTAMIVADGHERRYNCEAEPNEAEAGALDWTCVSAVDEQALTEIEEAIRLEFASRGIVAEAEMRRVDDDHMAGVALLSDDQVSRFRIDCIAERVERTADFWWACVPPEE